MNEKNCPVCGSHSIVCNEVKENIDEAFGGRKTISVKEYMCEDCESEGDFFDENEECLKTTIAALKDVAVTNILDDFSNTPMSFSSMERALELPQRTLTKWKNNASRPSSTGIALLKLLRTFPWLIEVAEHKYDYAVAQKIHIADAVQQMMNHMDFNSDTIARTGVISTNKTESIRVQSSNADQASTLNIEKRTTEVKIMVGEVSRVCS